ncbi:MAG: rod shape-determining protein MreC [Eggerthella lenta]
MKFVGCKRGVNDAAEVGNPRPTSTLGSAREQRQLRELLSQADEYKQEAQRPRNCSSSGPTRSTVWERASSAIPTRRSQAVTIDKARPTGWRPARSGTPALSARCTARASTARPRLVPRRAWSRACGGVVRVSKACCFGKLDADAVVNPGDVVVTSGRAAATRPASLGLVKVDTASGQRRVIVSPNDTTGALEEVLVVFGVGAVGEADGNEGGDAS